MVVITVRIRIQLRFVDKVKDRAVAMISVRDRIL